MSNIADINLTVNGELIENTDDKNSRIRFKYTETSYSNDIINKIRAENVSLSKVFEIKVSPDYIFEELLRTSIKMDVLCEEDEIPIVILKNYWDNIENQLNNNNGEDLADKLLNSGYAVPCIFPRLEDKSNRNNKDLFSFKSIDFRNIFRNLEHMIDKSLYLFILKVKKTQQKEALGISLLDYRDEKLVPVESELTEVVKSNDKKIAIFVHGIASRVGKNFAGLYRCLNKEFNIFSFNYSSISKHITDNGEIFASNLSVFGEKPIHIFAHSMGGLVSRSAIIEHNAQVHTLLMAGTPNNGAIIAKLVKNGSLGLVGAARKLFIGILMGVMELTYEDIMAIRRGVMPGLSDLYPNSIITRQLNSRENFITPYLVLAGKKHKTNTDGIVNINSMCNVRGVLLPNIPIDNCFHTKYFVANSSFNLPKIISEAKTYLKI